MSTQQLLDMHWAETYCDVSGVTNTHSITLPRIRQSIFIITYWQNFKVVLQISDVLLCQHEILVNLTKRGIKTPTHC